MLYRLYQAGEDVMAPVRATARRTADLLDSLPEAVAALPTTRATSAAYRLLADTAMTHERRPFAIDSVSVPTGVVDVSEELVDSTPFAALVRFRKHTPAPGAKVLVLAPLSGHFSTLLRDTVETMLPDHDVHITDWSNARDVAVASGRFGLDEYADHVIRFLHALGPGAHLLAVCQPCVQALAATALMAEDGDPCTPRTLTLMAGPIDTRINPTKVNDLAVRTPIRRFERHAIATVPRRYRGAGRKVYPGFLQLSAFLSMNLSRHARSHIRLYRNLCRGDDVAAEAAREFYDEYFAVQDLTAEFYLETVERVFQTHDLARGALEVHGRAVEPAAITTTALLTVEGDRDDICSIGQTSAAHDLCSGLDDRRRQHHLQTGVGHYGVFSGQRWRREVYPVIRKHISDSELAARS